jgi:hypothetical protein
LFFIIEVQKFKNIEDPKKQFDYANKIVKTFLKEDSLYQLNVSKNMIEQVTTDLSQGIVSENTFHLIAFDVEWSLDGVLKDFKMKTKSTLNKKRKKSFPYVHLCFRKSLTFSGVPK